MSTFVTAAPGARSIRCYPNLSTYKRRSSLGVGLPPRSIIKKLLSILMRQLITHHERDD
jgi:hypothetical protein